VRALSVPELLGVWERGLAQGPVERALTLLSAACPETSRAALAALSIGCRDASLLTLRECTFGPEMASVVMCPGCGQRPELNFNVSDVRVSGAPEASALPANELTMAVSDYELQFRPPNSLDVAAVIGRPDAVPSRQLLFERCLIAAHRKGEPTTADRLPAEVLDAVAERLSQADPQADLELEISCPFCGQHWRAAFDIVTFFWSEIDAWARRILREVDTLASAYGWCEEDILALSPARRQFYLETVGAWGTS
jgi:hypothetical protein